MNCCKHCESEEVVKNGRVRDQQRYKCKICGLNFVPGDKRVKADTAIKRAFAVMLYSLGKSSYGLIAKLFGVTPPAVQKWLKREAALLGAPEMPATIKEMEFDEIWHFIGSKKNNIWIIKAVDRASRRTVAWVVGGRDAATFQRLYEQVKH